MTATTPSEVLTSSFLKSTLRISEPYCRSDATKAGQEKRGVSATDATVAGISWDMGSFVEGWRLTIDCNPILGRPPSLGARLDVSLRRAAAAAPPRRQNVPHYLRTTRTPSQALRVRLIEALCRLQQ